MAKAYQGPLEFHPAAKKYDLLDGKERAELKADIEANGQIHPGALLDGMVLDGRNRYLICVELSLPFRAIELAEDTDPEWYSFAANVLRRQLTPSQRAMLAVKADPLELKTPIQVAEVAKISHQTVKDARKVAKQAIPAVQKAVAEGTVSASDAAKIVNKSPAVQAKAVERVKRGEAKTVAAAVKGKRGVERRSKPEQFKAITDLLSRMVKELDRLNKVCPGEKFYRSAEGHLESFARSLKEWKVAVR